LLAEGIGEEIRLWRRLVLLLFLEAAEEEVEQAFRGGLVWREPDGAGHQQSGGNGHPAAPHALIGQLRTQRLPHPTQKLAGAGHGPAPFTLVGDGKRAMSKGYQVEKKVPPFPTSARSRWKGDKALNP
jgi:hypothetical protein